MFKTTNYQKILGLNDELYNEYLKRSASYLKGKKVINKATFESHFFILLDVQKKQAELKAKERKFKTTNLHLLKYMNEVVNAYEKEGLGYVKIEKMLWINHRVKVSKTTIERFIKANNLVKFKSKKDG